MLPRFEYYKGKNGDWYWRIRARNNRIIADGSEGYKTKAGVRKAMERAWDVINEAWPSWAEEVKK
jgi:uncharacterized protein YegP (UPF0339 family)